MTIHSDPWPTGTPCWVDLTVPDVAAAVAFYGPVCGWQFLDTGEDFGHYTLAQTKGKNAAAITPPMQEGTPAAWTVYLASDDVDGSAKLITENGGTLLVEPMDVPGTGRMAIAADPSGGVFGLWQAAGMTGFEIVNEPGSLTWNDARLHDVEATKAFYAAVFGYTYEGLPGAPEDYSTFSVEGEVRGGMGGMMGAPEGTPSHWVSYFTVVDADASVATAAAAGATILRQPEDTPFGRMAYLTDPFGATFALHQAPPAQ